MLLSREISKYLVPYLLVMVLASIDILFVDQSQGNSQSGKNNFLTLTTYLNFVSVL